MYRNILNRNIASLSLFCFVAFCMACQQHKGDYSAVMRKCNEIDKNLPNLIRKTMDGFPEPGKRRLVGYFKDDDPMLINEEYYGDSEMVANHYYFNADEMIYALQEEYIYNRPMDYTEDKAKENNDSVWHDDKKTIRKTSSYFFEKNQLVKWINSNKKEVPPTDPEFLKKQSILVSGALLDIKIFKANKEFL